MRPAYLDLSPTVWQEKTEELYGLFETCRVCPRECGADRAVLHSSSGYCGMGMNPVISSANLHFGEEKPLVGKNGSLAKRGSGTIFFTSCNLACVYCQNYDVSQLRLGQEITVEGLTQIMLRLQKRGALNINLVTPSIWVSQIVGALSVAAQRGLMVPIVYNTGGYDRVETLRVLDGVIDIYMPDIKYSDNQMGLKYSDVPDNLAQRGYWDVVQEAVKEMHRQVSDLVINEAGVAEKGLLVRHLVLPNDIAGTEKVMWFLANEISKDTYVNIMDQYWVANKAANYPELARRTTPEEFAEAVQLARKSGLWRFDHTVPR